MLMKSKIKKKTECTVFLETVTIIAEIIAMNENMKKNPQNQKCSPARALQNPPTLKKKYLELKDDSKKTVEEFVAEVTEG